jgi:hypothetical protein
MCLGLNRFIGSIHLIFNAIWPSRPWILARSNRSATYFCEGYLGKQSPMPAAIGAFLPILMVMDGFWGRLPMAKIEKK